MKLANVIGHIFCAVLFSSVSILGLTACGGDSGPTPGGLAIITTSLPEGQINQPYSASVGGSGGALPYLWSVTPALPAGLSFNTQSGAITGTPGTVGTSSHTFTLVDSSIPPQTIETALSLTIKPPLSITTTSLPAGNIGAVYNQSVQTVGGFGPLSFNIVVPGTGTLPPGFNLNPTTGAISGTATTTGTFPFTVRVADTSGQQDTQAFSIRIDPQSPPRITTTSLPGGTVSLPYNQTVQAAAGIGTLTWSITVGSLPPGLTIGPSLTGPSVTISGTPTTQGTFNFTVRVTDTLGQFDTRALSISINVPAPPNITTTTLPSGTIGQPYNQAVLATGTGPLTFSIVSPGTGTLPPGLTLNASGTITGAPTSTGTFPFTVRVADTFGQNDTQALSILVSTDNPPQIVPPSLSSGTVGVPYGPVTIQATGGMGAVTWSISVGSLPPGLTIDPLTGPSVTISGTPSSQGTFSFTLRVTDSLGQSDTQALSITINLPPPLNITTTSPLPGGSIGQAYNQTLQATGGTGARTWTISAGALPLGLNLDATTGVISGTPILPAGTSNFTVRVQDAFGQDDTQDLSITISLFNVPNITTTTLQGGTVNQPYSQSVAATGGIGALTWSISAGTLPQGLNIDQITGVISGTPTTAATANFTVRVADTLGQSDTQALSITISDVLAITTTSLPNAKEGEAYTTTLQSSGGLAPISWSVNPSLPDGLALNSATGEISGTPGSGTGTGAPQTFTFSVQDSTIPTSQIANQPLDLTIDPP
ncbi:MAG TPA: putative Ig domain-containing protein [Nitrospira sp.]|nr:putative Ig domain-containing protein [Nitrospira sp.]